MGDPMMSPPPGPEHDPYQPPRADLGGGAAYYGGGYDQEAARAAISPPAIFLIVLASLQLLLGVCGLVSNVLTLVGVIKPDMSMFANLPPEFRQALEQQMSQASIAMSIGVGVFQLAAAGLILFGALQMRSLRLYGLAITTAVIAIVPCPYSSPCCCLAMIPGIWALVVLLRPEVKQAFEGQQGMMPPPG